MQNELDSGIGDIMQALNASGVYEDTFVFFTADNGYVCIYFRDKLRCIRHGF